MGIIPHQYLLKEFSCEEGFLRTLKPMVRSPSPGVASAGDLYCVYPTLELGQGV